MAGSEPFGQLLLPQHPACNRLHGPDRVDWRELQLYVVVGQKDACDHPRRALVAVTEAMVACQAKGVGGGEVGGVRFWIAVLVRLLRPHQGRFDPVFIAQAIQAAVLRQPTFVDCVGEVVWSQAGLPRYFRASGPACDQPHQCRASAVLLAFGQDRLVFAQLDHL